MASAADKPKRLKYPYLPPLAAGALAGISVDVALYPLDTLKTRLQSAQGFQKAGGFRGVYRGLLTVATSSMPTTALFFMSYETTKKLVQPLVAPQYAPFVHMFAASVGEVLACVIRVPTEIAKQRKQTYVGTNMRSSIAILAQGGWLSDDIRKAVDSDWKKEPKIGLSGVFWEKPTSSSRLTPADNDDDESVMIFNRLHKKEEAYKTEGFQRGLYRGFLSTVARDLPFSFIELPIWEMLKTSIRNRNDGQISSFQSALCGSIAGGFAAAVTTPLDLAKTRIMLAEEYSLTRKLSVRPVLSAIYLESGIKGLFAGVTPRMTGFMLGGFVFFGVYDDTKRIIEKYLER